MRPRSNLPTKTQALVTGLAILILAVGAVVYRSSHVRPPRDALKELKETASFAYQDGNFKRAITGLKTYLKTNAGDVEARNLLAASYAQVGDNEAALEETERILDVRKSDPDTLYRAGQLANQLNRPEIAMRYFGKAVDARPDMVQYHYRLAETYTKVKRYDQAITEWEKVLNLTPSDEPHRATVFGKIGNIYMVLGLAKKARKSYNKGLVLNPDDPYLKAQLSKARR